MIVEWKHFYANIFVDVLVNYTTNIANVSLDLHRWLYSYHAENLSVFKCSRLTYIICSWWKLKSWWVGAGVVGDIWCSCSQGTRAQVGKQSWQQSGSVPHRQGLCKCVFVDFFVCEKDSLMSHVAMWGLRCAVCKVDVYVDQWSSFALCPHTFLQLPVTCMGFSWNQMWITEVKLCRI